MEESDIRKIMKQYEVPRFVISCLFCRECKFKTHWRNKAILHSEKFNHELTPVKEESFVDEMENK